MKTTNLSEYLIENRWNKEVTDDQFVLLLDIYIKQKKRRKVSPFPAGVSEEDKEAILLDFANKNKLSAVKRLKECTGWGLKESKDWMDNYWANLEKEVTI